MKKKLLLVCFSLVVVVFCFAPFAASAAPTSTQVAWLSNRVSGDYLVFELILPTYDQAVYTSLTPNTNYYLNNTPFRTDENGRIPSGSVTFTAWSYQWTVYDLGYGYALRTNDGPNDFWESHTNANFIIYASDGDADSEFDAGFNAGKLEGISIGRREGYQDGLDEGYADGLRDGYDEGYRDGLETTEVGNWRSLFTSVVEAPLNVLYGILDFEILGFNLKNAIGAVIVLCVVIIVVKAVV